jgi:hypothetical protein
VGKSDIRPTRLWVVVMVVPLPEATVVANSITPCDGHDFDRSVIAIEMSSFASTIPGLEYGGLTMPG